MMTKETEAELNSLIEKSWAMSLHSKTCFGTLHTKSCPVIIFKQFISTHFTDNRVLEEKLLIKCECEDGGCSNCSKLCELIDNTNKQ